MILLKVTYRVRAHQISTFETIFRHEIEPLIRDHGLAFRGIWKTRVGPVGEFLELWEFKDMSDFDTNWFRLIQDPRLQEIFERTGPMVEGEEFSVLEPAALGPDPEESRQWQD